MKNWGERQRVQMLQTRSSRLVNKYIYILSIYKGGRQISKNVLFRPKLLKQHIFRYFVYHLMIPIRMKQTVVDDFW